LETPAIEHSELQTIQIVWVMMLCHWKSNSRHYEGPIVFVITDQALQYATKTLRNHILKVTDLYRRSRTELFCDLLLECLVLSSDSPSLPHFTINNAT